MAPRKIIIDTDPGVDDILAMLLAFSALPEELEVLLISVTYGNIDVQNCLRNVVSMFHHVEKEISWRKAKDRAIGFDAIRKSKPVVAVGPTHPLTDQMLMADFFHGRDGLGDIHRDYPHLTPAESWKELFEKADRSGNADVTAEAEKLTKSDALFTPSREPAHKEILRLLKDNEPDSVTIVAIGPLTNLAIAAAEDPEAFLRVHEIVVMGGTIAEAGNITPAAEFNTFADSVAAARVYALTSPNPRTTMPPIPPAPSGTKEGESPPPYLRPYPDGLDGKLKVTLFPLDITSKHSLTKGKYDEVIKPLLDIGSPLAEWTNAFMEATFRKIHDLHSDRSGDEIDLDLHDPLCIWYTMTTRSGELSGGSNWNVLLDQDIRVETSGQWTRGMCIRDTRSRKKRDDDDEHQIPGDTDNWLSTRSGNRLRWCVGSLGADVFAGFLLDRVFALQI